MRRSGKPFIDDIDPRFWESDFHGYLQSPTVPIANLLRDYERRAYRGQISDESMSTKCLIRLHPPHLASLKSRIAFRVVEAGGEVRIQISRGALLYDVVVRSDDGLTFTTHFPGG